MAGKFKLPKSLRRTFVVEEETTTQGGDGRPKKAWTEVARFDGMLSESTYRELQLSAGQSFTITNLVTQPGAPVAKLRQRLRLVPRPGHPVRLWTVEGVENPADLGAVTVYQCEEVTPGAG